MASSLPLFLTQPDNEYPSDNEYLFTLQSVPGTITTVSLVRDVTTQKAKVMIADVPLQVLIPVPALTCY
jgi:hypothetical protein